VITVHSTVRSSLLDRTVDPSAVLEAVPAFPACSRARPRHASPPPRAPLEPGRSYRLTVKQGFTALDGSALAEAVSVRLPVSGPELLAGQPIGTGQTATISRARRRWPRVLERDRSGAAPASRLLATERGRVLSRRTIRLELVRQLAISGQRVVRAQECRRMDRDQSGGLAPPTRYRRPAERCRLGAPGVSCRRLGSTPESPGEFRRCRSPPKGVFARELGLRNPRRAELVRPGRSRFCSRRR